MSILDAIAENKIQEAIQRGELEQRAFHGVPIAVDDDFSVSAEVRFVLRRLGQMTPDVGDPSPLVAAWRARRYKALARHGPKPLAPSSPQCARAEGALG